MGDKTCIASGKRRNFTFNFSMCFNFEENMLKTYSHSNQCFICAAVPVRDIIIYADDVPILVRHGALYSLFFHLTGRVANHVILLTVHNGL